ncbi:bromodomain-containing protein 8 [Drosophila tropicalis]|uniref:bromodomain-containing protein 8 n=1 Tax=Drosophila tropicalis TaxID=46794 RepID=UPI0035ABE4BD
MSGIQERLQLSRTPLDTWSKREQLCLASAVSCSGDQNWISVSRTLKTVCGGNGNNNNRPVDWYSQKNCAVQYGHMLESVETTKRKKRSSESSVSSPATVEPPTELLLRRLTEERLQEIKAQMRSDQEMYRKIQLEIETLQSDEMTEQELQTMWQEIEKTQEAKRIEEMTMENRLREREQRKKELALNWRQTKRSTPTTPDTNTTAVDMDVEQQPPSAAVAPSPLLTSLLSTTSAGATSSSTSAGATVSVARTTAPTITSLLTSGPTSIPNQPAIKGDPALMARPISGPPGSESLTPSTPTTPGKSPSQAAPTLSMLLEQKNKNATAAKGTNDAKTTIGDSVSLETAPPAPAAASASVGPDAGGDETDPNDEQLLEVFQNIMMNDIDIAMASAIEDEILKNVDDVDVASPTNNPKADEVIDFEDKLDALKRDQTNPVKKLHEVKPVEVVIGSSDDSNDNVPLATVATNSSESKDRDQAIGEGQAKESSDPTTEPLISEVGVEEINETITLISSSSEDTADVPTATLPATEDTSVTESKKGEESDLMEKEKESGTSPEAGTTIVETEASTEEGATRQDTPGPPTEVVKQSEDKPTSGTDDESSAIADVSKTDSKLNKQPTNNKSFSMEEQSKADVVDTNPPQPPSAPTARAPLLRKLPHRDRSESPMVDDDTTTASDHSTARSSTRRRCSSTPVIDSIPNSPASSEHNHHDDRRETRAASRKLFQTICSTLFESKHSSPFRRPFHDEHAQRHAELCLRPMDLPSIKRNIESGVIRNINELHRDVLLMTQNVLVAYKPHTSQHKTALLFWKDCQAIKEFAAQQIEILATTPAPNSVSSSSSSNTTATSSSSTSSKTDKDKEKSSANKARSGSRKSQRHH